MPIKEAKGFQAVIDRLTPTDTTGTPEEITEPGTLQRSHKGFNEITASDHLRNFQRIVNETCGDESGNLQSLPGTPEEIINETCGDETGNRLSDRTFQTTLETDIISGDNGDESNPEGFKGDVIKNMVRDSVDRIVVSINSSKRILDRIYKYKDYKPEGKK